MAGSTKGRRDILQGLCAVREWNTEMKNPVQKIVQGFII